MVQGRASAVLQHPPGRREGLRDRSGKAGARQGASLHARRRNGGARLGGLRQALAVRQSSVVHTWYVGNVFVGI